MQVCQAHPHYYDRFSDLPLKKMARAVKIDHFSDQFLIKLSKMTNFLRKIFSKMRILARTVQDSAENDASRPYFPDLVSISPF